MSRHKLVSTFLIVGCVLSLLWVGPILLGKLSTKPIAPLSPRSQAAEGEPKPFTAPALTATPSEIDLGEIKTSQALYVKTLLRNQGKVPIEIVESRASCSCLKPTLAKNKLQPGEEAELRFGINTLNQPAGAQRWNAQITYNVGERQEQITFTLKARLVAEVTVVPADLTLYVNQPIKHEILVTDTRSTPLAITKLLASSPSVKAEVTDRFTNKKGQLVYRIGLVIKPDQTSERVDERLTIYTNDVEYRDWTVPITIIKATQARVVPSVPIVRLQGTQSTGVPAKLVVLRDAREQSPIEIERIACEHPAVKVTHASGPGNYATVRFSVDRAQVPDNRLLTSVHIHVKSPAAETLVLPVEYAFE